MTRDEALKIMKNIRECVSDHDRKAFDMTIKAFNQEQYYKDLAQSYERVIIKLIEAIAERG